ncbi:MAG: ABC transporter permease [Propionibacterium sp.]|nr:ABC transporter permease [Propionibacterium sp.]
MFSVNNFGLGIIPDILLQSAAIGTMALGATFIIATGGIDLSVGTGMTFCAVMAGVFMFSQFMDLPLGLGLLLTLLVGVAVGLVNGMLIAFLGLPPFIATLAMMMVTRGLSLIISKSSSIKIANPDYFAIANGDLLPFLSNAALIFVILGIAAAVLLSKTLLGRYALAIGSNEEATRLSGINVKVWKLLVYVIAGLFTAFGAILYSARFGFVQPAEGLGMELQVIAAVVIGGTSLSGGRANIVGTMTGALLMMTLTVGLQMMGVQQQWQFVVTGVVVMLAVYADILRRKRAAAAL